VPTSAERKALNEATFRKANERLDDAARELVADDAFVPFICECPRSDCMHTVLLTLAEYEGVRSGSRQGLAAIGHEDLTVERVLAHNDRFVLTEKTGRAGEVYGDADPRRA
jgi:hypothetical protein